MPTPRPDARTLALGLAAGAMPALPGLVLNGAGMAAAITMAPRGADATESGGATEHGGDGRGD